MQNKKADSDSENEENEIEDVESGFENHGTSERHCYRPISTFDEDVSILNKDSEISTVENEIKKIHQPIMKISYSPTVKASNRVDTGLPMREMFG